VKYHATFKHMHTIIHNIYIYTYIIHIYSNLFPVSCSMVTWFLDFRPGTTTGATLPWGDCVIVFALSQRREYHGDIMGIFMGILWEYGVTKKHWDSGIYRCINQKIMWIFARCFAVQLDDCSCRWIMVNLNNTGFKLPKHISKARFPKSWGYP
jgi:hypothetical protein